MLVLFIWVTALMADRNLARYNEVAIPLGPHRGMAFDGVGVGPGGAILGRALVQLQTPSNPAQTGIVKDSVFTGSLCLAQPLLLSQWVEALRKTIGDTDTTFVDAGVGSGPPCEFFDVFPLVEGIQTGALLQYISPERHTLHPSSRESSRNEYVSGQYLSPIILFSGSPSSSLAATCVKCEPPVKDGLTVEFPTVVGAVEYEVIQKDGNFLDWHLVGLDGAFLTYALLSLSALSVYVFKTLTSWRQMVRPMHLVIVSVLVYLTLSLFAFGWYFYVKRFHEDGWLLMTTWFVGVVSEKVLDIAEMVTLLVLASGWQVVRRGLSPIEYRCLNALGATSATIGIFELLSGTIPGIPGFLASAPSSEFRSLLSEGVTNWVFLARFLIQLMSCSFSVVMARHTHAIISMELAMSNMPSIEASRLYAKRDAYFTFYCLLVGLMCSSLIVSWLDTSFFELVDRGLCISVFWALRTALLTCIAFLFRPRVYNIKLMTFALIQRQAVLDAQARSE